METYLNPVYHHSFPDPFVLKFRGEYWAYSTGVCPDGRCFGVLRSRDLVSWEDVGGALEPLAEPHPQYWAPEVTYHNGRFYLYYSVGDEVNMHIRVAVADRPAGPFLDSGRRLTGEQFAIDAHVFVAADGAWHLFYATDFLDRAHVGTGTVRDRLLDPLTLEGRPTPVALPRYDWHVFDPRRAEKGGVRWHTIEGPFVLERKRRFYQMFSGGNWQNLSYGVSYALADRIDQPGEWRQVADGERVLPVLRTLPGQVIGPGHNSVVRGPDNMQLYCVYHRWSADGGERVLAIDRLDWAGERMLVLGPSHTPQLAPAPPVLADFFDDEREGGLGEPWACAGGRWAAREGAALQLEPRGRALALAVAGQSFVAEVSLRALGQAPGGSYGLALGDQAEVLLAPARRELIVRARDASGRRTYRRRRLPADFDARADHLLRVERDAGQVAVSLDGIARCTARLAAPDGAGTIALVTKDCAAAFAGFALSLGWQDTFADQGASPADRGWQAERGGDWRIEGGRLYCDGGSRGTIVKGPPLEAYELVVSVRLEEQPGASGCYGFYPALRDGDRGPLLTVERDGAGWALVHREGGAARATALPGFAALDFQQFRFRKQGGRLAISWEARDLGEIPAPAQPTRIGLHADHAAVAFDMVRVAALSA